MISKEELKFKLAAVQRELDAHDRQRKARVEAALHGDVDDEIALAVGASERMGLLAVISELQARIDAWPHSPGGEALCIRSIGGLCPVQSEGYFDGEPYYFRARGDQWQLFVGEGAGLVDGTLFAEAIYGQWPDAGYMPEEEATAIIRREFARWQQQKISDNEQDTRRHGKK